MLAILCILNIIFTVLVVCGNPKIAKDLKFVAWRNRHRASYASIMIASALISFKLSRIHASYFLGRKSFLAEYDDQRAYLKLSQSLAIAFILLGNAPIILIDLGSLTYSQWGSQLYINLIETIVLSVTMIVL